MKIKKGEYWKCIRTRTDSNFTVGNVYKSDDDGCLIDESMTSVMVTESKFDRLYNIQELKDGEVAVDNRRAHIGEIIDLSQALGQPKSGYFKYYYYSDGSFVPADEVPDLPLQSAKDFLAQMPKHEPHLSYEEIEKEKELLTKETIRTLDSIRRADDDRSNAIKRIVEALANDPINPKHYSFNIKGTPCDLFDIINAMGLDIEQATALRYFRKKKDPIEDTKKAIKCLERYLEKLNSNQLITNK